MDSWGIATVEGASKADDSVLAKDSHNSSSSHSHYKDNSLQDTDKPFVSVIMLVYRLSKLVTHSIRAVEKVMEANGYSYEMVVVDDGSFNDTYYQTLKAPKNQSVRVYKLPKNMGKEFTLIYGFKKNRAKET